MTPRHTIEIRTPVRALLIASGLTIGLSLGAAAQTAAADGTLLQPTPLILKDGRIANVSVHLVPFPSGQSALGPMSLQRLGNLTAVIATDCFLTAQVIGHVGATEVAANDTLSAHRLARARADTVQASLIADGLPAKAIASVWDWQFMVREARATLWVFRLTPGEDCDGTPVDGAPPALVAGAEPQPGPAPGSEPRAAAIAAPSVAGGAAPDAAAPPDRQQMPAAYARSTESPPPAPSAAMAAGPAPAPVAVPSIIQALPAASPSTTTAATGAAEVKPPASLAAPLPAASPSTTRAATDLAAARPPTGVTETLPATSPSTTKAATDVAAARPPIGVGEPLPAASPRSIRTATDPASAAEILPATSPSTTRDATGTAAAEPPASFGETLPAASPSTTRADTGTVRVEPPGSVAEALPAPTRAPAKPVTEVIAALPDRTEPATGPAAGEARAAELMIIFPTNSSYFPPGTGVQLRALLRQLATGQPYEVVLQTSVSGSRSVVGAETADEAAQYNQWLAERRVERVQDWFAQNAEGREVVIKPAYRADDESRQVVVRIRPTG